MKVAEGHAPGIAPRSGSMKINALEPYERLLRNFEQCPLEGNQILSTCKAVQAFETEMTGVSREIAAKVGEKMIAHHAPAVRVQAAAMVRFDVLRRAAQVERDPRVLEAFVRIAGKQAAHDPEAQAMLIAASKHVDAGVRLDVVAQLASTNFPRAAETLVALAEHDADVRVRRAACEQAGKLDTDAVLPLYERATANASDPDFYSACMEGLSSRVTKSEGAYRLFLRRIAETPRSQHTPPWTVMSLFCDLPFENRPSWIDAKEVRTVLASVIADRAASMQARSAAVESLAGLGATPVELATLRKTLSEAGDKPLVEKIAAICE